MTNKERLLQDGSNCPYGDMHQDCHWFMFSIFDDNARKVCPESCKKGRVKHLETSIKGRRWLDDECEGVE